MDKTTEFISHDMIKFKFEIQNFKFNYKNRQKLNIHSDPIIIGYNNKKTSWRLGLETTDDDSCSPASRVTVSLQLESLNNSEITTQFSLGLLSKTNRTRQIGNYDVPKTFKRHEKIGYPIAPFNLCSNYVKDGTVTIFLSIKTDGSVSLNRENSAKIYDTRQLADCCFIIGENRIMAHKTILAENSKFFYELFVNDPNLNEIDLTDENVDVACLQKVLYFMYHGYTNNDLMENTDVLLKLSLKFGLAYLTKICVSVICSALTVENAIDILKLAFACDLSTLKHGVIMFIDNHILEISKTQAWLHLLENNFEMIKDWIISLSLVQPKISNVQLSSNYTEQGYRPRYPSKKMNENEKKFLQELSTDVLLKVESLVIKAEKSILSEKSSVFQAMFSYQMSENKENIVNITDVEFDTLRELVRYMYCEKIYGLDTLAISLIAAADKYNMADLKSICENYLHSIMDMENLVDLLQASEFYVAQKLKKECTLFVGQHLQHFLNNKGFLDVIKNNPPKFLNQMILIWAEGLKNSKPSTSSSS